MAAADTEEEIILEPQTENIGTWSAEETVQQESGRDTSTDAGSAGENEIDFSEDDEQIIGAAADTEETQPQTQAQTEDSWLLEQRIRQQEHDDAPTEHARPDHHDQADGKQHTAAADETRIQKIA